MPKIKRRFAMFAPITFPITISLALFNTDKMAENNSGSEVPIATIVIPIIKGESPKKKSYFFC